MLATVARAQSCPPQLDLSFVVAVTRAKAVEGDAADAPGSPDGEVDAAAVDTASSHSGAGHAAQDSTAASSYASSSTAVEPVKKALLNIVEGVDVQLGQTANDRETGAVPPYTQVESSAPRPTRHKSHSRTKGRSHGHHRGGRR